MSQEQAEGLAIAMADALQEGLATKSDLDAAKATLQSDLAATEARLQRQIEAKKVQIEASKADVLKWMFGTIGFQTLLLLGAVVGLSPMAHP